MLNFFDKLEDRVRSWFSRRPILYALIGSIGLVLFWRGIWHATDFLAILFLPGSAGSTIIDFGGIADALISLSVGFVLLLSTGLFVSDFIGAEIITKGLKGEEKLARKTEAEEKAEEGTLNKVHNELHGISKRLARLEKESGPGRIKK